MLAAWEALPEIQRKSVAKANAKSFFNTRNGVKVAMQDLQELAYAPECRDGDIHAGAGAASAAPRVEDSAWVE